MNTPFTIEIVIDSIHSAIAAQEGGADRVELCDNLFEGGTTPSRGCIELVRREVSIGLNVMIRPRGGDFLYSDLEFEIMKKDIDQAKLLGADAVVFGILQEDGRIDKERTAALMEIAYPMDVTFHRAFDMTPDPYEAIDDLMSIGVQRLLTSGQEATAFEGAQLIAVLAKRTNGRMVVMPGSGIKTKNIKRLSEMTGCQEFHLSGRVPSDSRMDFRKSGVYMGGTLRQPEFTTWVADANTIKAAREALGE